MSYTLKSTGLATDLVMCVAVDDDGTIKEFVSPTADANKTLGTGVAASVAMGAWKGSARRYWASSANGSFDYHGVRFTDGFRPAHNSAAAAGFTLWEAYHSATAGSGTHHLIHYTATGISGSTRAGGKMSITLADANRGSGTTTLPTDGTTKYSAGFSFRDATGVGTKFYYGLEAGSLAADGTSTAGVTFGSSGAVVYGIGGCAGQGHAPAARYCSLLFDRELSEAELQSLHDDWFGVLFDAPAAPPLAGKNRSLLGIG